MAKHKANKKGDERLEAVEEVLSKSERFIEDNQKIITIAVLVLVAIILGYLGLKKYYFEPRELKAQKQIFMAEKFFESDSLNLALYGDGNNLGFLEVIDDFGSTKTGKLAQYYAGISFLKLGEYQQAIDHLKKFNGKDHLISAMAVGGIGDAYLELNQPAKALEYYVKASKLNPNELTTPFMLFKAGRTSEIMGNYSKAVEFYETIKTNYPTSTEGRTIEKFLEKARALNTK